MTDHEPPVSPVPAVPPAPPLPPGPALRTARALPPVHPVHLDSGARAVDALDPDEIVAFDGHLAECEPCRIELAEFQATAAQLGAAVAAAPPADLRPRVLASIARLPQLPPLTSEPDRVMTPAPRSPDDDQAPGRPAPVLPLRRAWYRRPVTLLVAAAAIAAIVVGSVVLANRPGPQSATGDVAMQQCVAAAPDAYMMMPTVGAGGDVTMAHSCHAAVVRVDGLPVLPSGQTYQLWVMAPSGARSVGMLGAEPSAEHPMVTAVHDNDTDIRVSVEPAERIHDAIGSARVDGGSLRPGRPAHRAGGSPPRIPTEAGR